MVMTTTKTPSPTKVPPPPAWKLLMVPVGLTMLIVVVVFVTTLFQADALVASAQAADPSAPHGGILAQVWGRVAFGVLLAVSWPLALRQLGRGSLKVYARCRRVAIIAAVLLLAVTLFDSGPSWLQIAHGLLALSEIGIFAAAMHPQMRAWYAKNR